MYLYGPLRKKFSNFPKVAPSRWPLEARYPVLTGSNRVAASVMAARRSFVGEARPFSYEFTGDIRGSGTAMSLVFTNTTSIGSQMPVSGKTPEAADNAHMGRTPATITAELSPLQVNLPR